MDGTNVKKNLQNTISFEIILAVNGRRSLNRGSPLPSHAQHISNELLQRITGFHPIEAHARTTAANSYRDPGV